jgi:hypothetical protein
MRRCPVFAVAIAMSIATLAAQDLPKESNSFEVEPPLLIQPDVSAKPTPSPHADVEQLAQQLERAKKSAASAESLFRTGVLAKVEAEQRALRVVRLQAELSNAQLAEMKERLASQQSRVQVGEVAKADLDLSDVTVARALAAAQTANANLAKAQLEAATLNLQRQQKLLAVGSARKSDVARAEEKLAALRRTQH